MGALDKLNSSMSLVRELISAKEKLQVAELQVKLAVVMGDLAEVKIQMIELQNEIDRNDHLAELRQAFKFHSTEGSYILEKEMFGYKTGHYCPVCFGKDNKVIPLGLYLGMGAPMGHQCNVCESKFVNVDESRFGTPFSQGSLTR